MSSILKVKLEKFRDDLGKLPILCTIEETTKIPKEHGVLSVGILLAALLYFKIQASLISNIIGFSYPAYCSIKAITKPGSEVDRQWLLYWVIFSALIILEDVCISILLMLIPFYYICKVVFLVWAFMPSTEGAAWLYNHVLKDMSGAGEQQEGSGGRRKGGIAEKYSAAKKVPSPVPEGDEEEEEAVVVPAQGISPEEVELDLVDHGEEEEEEEETEEAVKAHVAKLDAMRSDSPREAALQDSDSDEDDGAGGLKASTAGLS